MPLICAYTHIYIYIYSYAYMYTCTYVHMHIRTYICTHAHTHVCTHTHMYVHIHIRTYVNTYVHGYIRTYNKTCLSQPPKELDTCGHFIFVGAEQTCQKMKERTGNARLSTCVKSSHIETWFSSVDYVKRLFLVPIYTGPFAEGVTVVMTVTMTKGRLIHSAAV